jgi:hypothetical protein
MKIRIQGNSIRVRLTQSEVRAVGEGGSVEQSTAFSPVARLYSRVESSTQAQTLVATFDNQLLLIRVPANQARRWAESEEVGIESEQPIADGTSLRLLIEKDFECLHPRAEEIADAFPNPGRTGDPARRP